MARDLVLDVITKADSRGLNDTARDLDRVADSSDKTSSSFKGLGKDSSFLDSEIARLKGHIRELGQEFDRTGSKTLLKDIGKDKSQLRQLESLAKDMGRRGGQEFNKGFLSSLGDLGSNLRGAMIPAAIGAAVVLAPMLGGIIAGAVAGATGVGGIAGGILMASKDNAVRTSAQAFGAEISEEFFGGGDAFVAPIIESLDILRRDFASLELGKTFAPLADLLPTLAAGLGGFVKDLMPGLARAFEGMGPIIDAMAEELPTLGKTIGDFFDRLTNGQGAVTGMHTLFAALVGTIEMLGRTIDALATAWDGLARAGAVVTGWLEDMPTIIVPLSGVMGDLNDAFEGITETAPKVVGSFAPIPNRINDMATATDGAVTSVSHFTMSIDDLKGSLDALFDKQMNYDKAILEIQKDTLLLTQNIKDGAKSLDTHTTAGLNNREMILELIGDYEKQRDAAIAMGKGTGEATRKFDEQVDALGDMLTSLGMNKTEVDRLLAAYKKLHDAPDIKKEIEIHYKTTGTVGALPGGAKVPTFDTGGWVSGPVGVPQLAVVHGGEFVLSRDMLSGRAAAPAATSSQAAGGTARVELAFAPNSGDAVAIALGELVRRFVHINGGDAVTALSTRR